MHRAVPHRRFRRAAGFTLLELMLTVTVAAVLAAVAIPNLRDFMRNNRITGSANDLLRAVQLARNEAIKRQQVVAVCASADPTAADPTCSGGAFTGWIVFEDANNSWQREAGEPVITSDSAAGTLTLRNDRTSIMSYVRTGFTNSTPGQTPFQTLVICDERGNQAVGSNSTARALFVEATGRSRVSRTHADVTTAIAAAGPCP